MVSAWPYSWPQQMRMDYQVPDSFVTSWLHHIAKKVLVTYLEATQHILAALPQPGKDGLDKGVRVKPVANSPLPFISLIFL